MVWHLAKIPKKVFFYWGAQKLPFLRFMTISSFIKFNPDWEVIVYLPKKLSNYRPWNGKQFESRCLKYIDYTPRLKQLAKLGKLQLRVFDMKTIGFSNDLNEVHKSDILRYHLLHTYGGVWSDMDILYFKSIEAISVNTEVNADVKNVCRLCNDGDGLAGHSIGFLMGEKGSAFWKHVFSLTASSYKKTGYQSMGPDMMNTHFPTLEGCPHTISILRSDIYTYDADTDTLFFNYDPDDGKKSHNHYRENTIGTHWYGGHKLFKNVLLKINHKNYKAFPNKGFCIRKLIELFDEI